MSALEGVALLAAPVLALVVVGLIALDWKPSGRKDKDNIG